MAVCRSSRERVCSRPDTAIPIWPPSRTAVATCVGSLCATGTDLNRAPAARGQTPSSAGRTLIKSCAGPSIRGPRKLDIDENPGTAARFQVLSIPTMILFKAGEPVKTVVGAYPKKKLEAELEPALTA